MPWMMEVLTSERKNFNRPYSHSDPKDNAGEHLLRLAFAIGEHQPADDDCDQRQPGRNRAGKGGFEDVDRVIPRIAAGGLCIHGQCCQKEQHGGEPSDGRPVDAPG
jgi:hypothetical protein